MGTVVLTVAVGDADSILEAGETWTFTEAVGSDIFTYALTQPDLDSNGTAEPVSSQHAVWRPSGSTRQ